MRISFSILATSLAALTLAACESAPKRPENFQYWQRSSASSAIYMQGPKAQQMLHRDIARCVTEVKELEHLDKTQNALRTNPRNDRLLDPDKKKLQGYDTPEYNDYLLSEHINYHDFDSCMIHRGWERTRVIPYEIADRARDTYLESVEGHSYRSRYGREQEMQDQEKAPQSNSENLNEE